MEELSSVREDEWKSRSAEFTDWCHTSVAGIEGMTDAVAKKLEESVSERVSHLVRHAIEPAR